MTRSLDTFALNFSVVAPKLTLDELAVVCDYLAVELVTRQVVGVSALATVARSLRRRADQERAPAIFSTDCHQLGELGP